ncbi:MAG: hypothetical protein JWO90_2504, partial [Solirubrobacterales bacterium]|nr:hypothetical protein [Solirubrobacterales bacterium]
MAPAFEDPPPCLTLSSGEGRIALRMLAPAGATVTFSEGVDGQAAAIREVAVDPAPSPLPSATVVGAITWRCDRLVRRSVAFAVGPDGRRTQAAAEIRTPDRKERLEVVVRPGAANGVARFRVGGDAVWSARAPHPDGAADPLLTVGGATRTASTKGLPRIPVAGDSLMQGTHAFVAGRPRTAFDVTVDTRPGTGLAEPSAASWPGLAKQRAQRLKPAVTVISLRVSDGIPLEGEECCGPVRVARYATAARALMRTYV